MPLQNLNDKRFFIYTFIPNELREKMLEYCKLNDRSVSSMMRMAVIRFLENKEEKIN